MAVNANDKASVEMLANTLGSERHVIERIRVELARRDWSQAELSRRMEAFSQGSNGGVLHPVVLSKLLSGDRGRHISIDQLVTLAGIFEVSVAEMLLPPGSLEMAEVLQAFSDGPDLQRALQVAGDRLATAQDCIAQAMLTDQFWCNHMADALEQTLEAVEAQGRPLADSIRYRFLSGVVSRYNDMKASD